MKFVLPLLILIGTSTPSFAHNNFFVPGDAFFSTSIKKNFFANSKSQANKDGITFGYHRFSESFMLCGYAGCAKAIVTNPPKALETTLKKLFQDEVTKARTNQWDESKTPYFPVLIYNRDFDLKAYPVGLKFNEDYEKVQKKIFRTRHAVDDRIQDKALKKIDADYASVVPELKTTSIPENLVSDMGVTEPIVISGDDVKFVILLGAKAEDLKGHASKKSNLSLIVIEGENVSRMSYRDLKAKADK